MDSCVALIHHAFEAFRGAASAFNLMVPRSSSLAGAGGLERPLSGRPVQCDRERRAMQFFVSIACVLLLGEAASSRQYASADLAARFTYTLERQGQQAVATVDPAAAGTFIAALHVGSDLLVVRARHPSVDELRAEIRAGQYFRVFSALRATPTPDDKLFVVDAGADGILSSVPGGQVDTAREDDGPAIRFDGVFSSQGLTASEYDQRLAAVDGEYARLLRLLTSALRQEEVTRALRRIRSQRPAFDA